MQMSENQNGHIDLVEQGPKIHESRQFLADREINSLVDDHLPGDRELAEIHQQAWYIPDKRAKTPQLKHADKICQCCGRQVPKKRIDINCDNLDYNFLGSGISLYFEFIKQCLTTMLLFFVTSGDYNLFTNYFFGDYCQQKTDSQFNCVQSWVSQLSLINKKNQFQYMELQQMMNLVTIITIIIYLQYFRKHLRYIDTICDELVLSASDYTVWVKNIPRYLGDCDYDEEIKFYFNSVMELFPISKEIVEQEEIRKLKSSHYLPLPRIANVNLVYDVSPILMLQQQSNQYRQERKLSTQRQKTADLNSQIIDVESQIQILLAKFYQGQDVNQYFLGSCFLQFQWEDDAKFILNEFNKNNRKLKFRENNLEIIKAPNPSDVFWSNLHITNFQKFKRRLVSYIATLLTLISCTVLIYVLNGYQIRIADQNNNEQSSLNTILSYSASAFITILNLVLVYIIEYLSQYEKYNTQTTYNISQAIKLSNAQFFNTSLIYFIVVVILKPNISQEGGLVQNQTLIFFSNCIIPALIKLVDYWYWLKQIQKRYAIGLNQIQLNKLYEDLEWSISYPYATIICSFYSVAFYSSIIPISQLISCFTLVFLYWADKYNIARRRLVRHNISSEFCIQMVEQLEYSLPIYCCSNLYWYYEFNNKINYYAIAGIILGILHAIIPMQKVNDYIFPFQPKEREIKSFSGCKRRILN
ncbi:hypothetical protein pb186bvf_000028 [Paramecium bursaria]